jgi:radical SAM superfamily enzyme YgiQ (UPF0313 family)
MAKLLFIQDIHYEYLGPIYISAMLKRAGHDCRIAIGKSLINFQPVIEDYQPDIIGFSIMSGSAAWANELGVQIKNKYGLPTIFGGVHPTFYPEYIKNEGVDLLVRGDGEEAALEVMNSIEDKKDFGNIGNIIYKKNGRIIENKIRDLQTDLDIYPFPDRKLYEQELRKYNMDLTVRNVITSRGCPFSCTFCQAAIMRQIYKGKGNYVRIRKIDKVLEELLLLKNTTDVRSLYFVDDIFGLDFKWLKDFLSLYRKRVGLEFSCLVKADAVRKHKDYAKLLKDAGCRMVAFGIESGSERLRNELLKKEISNEDILSAASMLHDAGIKFRAFNIVGLPNETLKDAYETVQLNIDIKTDYPWCAIYLPIKDTALANYALNQKALPQDYFNKINKRSFFSGSSPLQTEDIERIVNLQRFFQTAVWWPWAFPLIKLLIKIPPNPIFNLWFGFIFYIVYTKSEGRNWWKTFLFAIKSRNLAT